MRTKFIIIGCCILLGLFSCTKLEESNLTDEDKANIEKEITTMVDSIVSSANELRTDYFKKVYWNDSQFIGVDLTGAKSYDDYMKETDEMYANMSSIKFSKEKLSIIVFDKNTAVALFEGNAEGKSKDGVSMNLDNFNASMVFRNVDGQWKVAYTHESAEQEIVMPEIDSSMTK